MFSLKLFLLVSLFSGASSSANCFVEMRHPSEYLQNNLFRVDRDLNTYNRAFPFGNQRGLLPLVHQLGPGSLWIDMGGGKRFALMKGLNLNPGIVGVDISFAKPAGALEPSESDRARFQEFHGLDLVEMDEMGLLTSFYGRVSLITDVFGPFSYGSDIRAIMKVYMKLLSADGRLYLTWLEEKLEQDPATYADEYILVNPVFSGRHATADGLFDWVRAQDAFELLSSATNQEYDGPFHWEKARAVLIQKGNVEAELTEPPEMTFQYGAIRAFGSTD